MNDCCFFILTTKIDAFSDPNDEPSKFATETDLGFPPAIANERPRRHEDGCFAEIQNNSFNALTRTQLGACFLRPI